MLRFSPSQGPGRFVFTDPDTNRVFSGKTKTELVTLIINYRAQNELEPIDYLDMAVEDYLCRLPENVGKCSEIEIKRGFFEYLHGGLNVLKNVFLGDKNMVSQEVAEERGAICATCPLNVFPDKDYFVEYSDRLGVASTGGRKVSMNDKLGSCGICGCILKMDIFSKKHDTKHKYPAWCWKKEV